MTRNRFLLTVGFMAIVAAGNCLLPTNRALGFWGGGQKNADAGGRRPASKKADATADPGDLDLPESEMVGLIERYTVDRGSLNRSYPVALSPRRHARLKQFYMDWRDRLAKLNFEAMGLDGRVDYILFRNHVDYELRQLEIQTKQFAEIEPLIPFAKTIIELEESRRRMQPINSSDVAALLTRMKRQIEEVHTVRKRWPGAKPRW